MRRSLLEAYNVRSPYSVRLLILKKLLPLSRLFCFLICVLSLSGLSATAQDKLLLTQVYGGGGSSSSTAAFKTDFVEVFNAGATNVDLTAYSVQYGPATGANATLFTGITTLTGTLAPGQYYLISEGTAGTGGATLTGADLTGSINLAAGSGKVALVKGTSVLGSSTNGCSDSSIVSLIGYGAIDSTCAAGGAAIATLDATKSATRTSSCTDTGNNAADFTVGTPVPRNTQTTLAPCSGAPPTGTTPSITSATAAPASVNSGDTTALTVNITAKGSVVTAVTANLSTIGGSVTQALSFTSPGATGTFAATYTAATLPATATGNYTLPVTVTDAANETATASISLTVTKPVAVTPISTIQANRSSYVGTTVSVTGVITGITSAGFFVQTPSSTPGSTGAAEGIYAFAGTGKVPATAVIGNNVTVTGNLTTYPSPSHTPALEINSPVVVVNATGNPLPAPVVLDATKLTPFGGLYQLTKYEGMRVSIASLTSASGTDGFLTENTETITSNGQFYAVITGTPQPFREPGIDIRDFDPSIDLNVGPYNTTGGVTYASKPTLFDDNPERLLVDSDFLVGGTPINLSTGAVLPNVTGILDFTYSSDSFYDPARFLLDPSYSAANITPGMQIVTVPAAAAGQFTVAAFNIERFFNTSAADNLYYNVGTDSVSSSSAVNVTAAAYARRLKKVSLAIRNVLNFPDIISIEEVENQSVLQDISNQISSDATAAGQADPKYTPLGVDYTAGTYTSDLGGISVGFLVKSTTANVVSVQQYGNKPGVDVVPGTTTTLNDRPPYVLHAGIKRAGAADYPITVIANHLRSLSGISTSASTRLKKEVQAEQLAALIQQFQSNGEHVVALGDMNAFEFSDAYTDTMATVTNTGFTSPDKIAQPGVANLVNPAPVDLVTLLPAAQRWSYNEFGNAQVLDHIVATADLVSAGAYITYAHFDADFPLSAYNDETTPMRTSDHDAAVSYYPLPAPKITGTLTGSGSFDTTAVGNTSNGSVFTLTNTGEGIINITGIASTGDFHQSNNCGTSLAVNTTCTINVVFTPTATGTRTGKLTINSNATNLSPVALTGTGVKAVRLALDPLFQLFDLTTVGLTSGPKTFTLSNPGAASMQIGSISVQGSYQQSNNCGSVLAAHSSCAIAVVFKPKTIGIEFGALTVTTTGAGASTLQATLLGLGNFNLAFSPANPF